MTLIEKLRRAISRLEADERSGEEFGGLMDDEARIIDRTLHRHHRVDGWYGGVGMDPHPRIIAASLALAILSDANPNDGG